MSDIILEADGVKAVSAVATEAKRRNREEAIIGRTVNKFGRIVLISRKKYAHMRKCGDLLLDLDGNQTRFTKLTQDQVTAYKTGNMKQNQQACSTVPEDITDFEVSVKDLLKKDHVESQEIRKDFVQHQIDVKNKKDGNITVITASDPEAVNRTKALELREKEIEAKERAIEDRETTAKADAEKEKELDAREKATKEKELIIREKAIEDREKELDAKAKDTGSDVSKVEAPKTNVPQGQGSNK